MNAELRDISLSSHYNDYIEVNINIVLQYYNVVKQTHSRNDGLFRYNTEVQICSSYVLTLLSNKVFLHVYILLKKVYNQLPLFLCIIDFNLLQTLITDQATIFIGCFV